jgi:hypothetical protein
VQERILHIKMINGPGAEDSQGEHHIDHGRLDYWAEGIIIVDVGSLGEATKDPASLVPFQRAVRVEVVLEDPFVSDDVGANRVRDKIPCVVDDQGSKFFFHGVAPVRIDEGGTDRGGHW